MHNMNKSALLRKISRDYVQSVIIDFNKYGCIFHQPAGILQRLIEKDLIPIIVGGWVLKPRLSLLNPNVPTLFYPVLLGGFYACEILLAV